LALTKLDTLTGFEELPVCVGYRYEGRELREMPHHVEILKKVEPIYETLPGWEEDISEIRVYEDLPANTRNYIKRVEELIGIPVSIVSVGPGREQTLIRDSLF